MLKTIKLETANNKTPKHRPLALFLILIFLLLGGAYVYFSWQKITTLSLSKSELEKEKVTLSDVKIGLEKEMVNIGSELKDLKSQDQYVINKKLEDEIKNINSTYKQAVATYEKLVDLRDNKVKTTTLDDLFAKTLSLLKDRNYASAGATLVSLDKKIKEEEAKLVASFKIPENVPAFNAPPSSGFRRQTVTLDIGTFLVDIVTADLNSTRVIVDTATDGDCRNDCPVLSLGEYAARSGAYAGVNGSYFCPATYPSCADKKNSFDTLAMNKNKKYINSDNNVYSNVPAVIFSGTSARFVGQSSQWGRDTGVDAVLANQPLLVSGGQVAFGGGSDPKQGSRGSRSFVGSTGSTAYIGVVHNATVAEVARVLQAIGIANALNLDSGGSTALWAGGYKVGPGRGIPNALLFVRK